MSLSANGAGTVTINGAVTYQTIDGFGVNANSLSWTNNQVQPVLDALINQAGMTLFVVLVDNANWEATNDNDNANVMNWSYYNTIYSSADFQKLWGMMAYLNQQGITNGLIPKVGGPVALWMGGMSLASGFENEYAETIASMLVYARNTEHLQFTEVRPANEPDNTYTGVNMSGPAQYVTVLHDLGAQLDTNGMSDVRFAGPDLAATSTNWMASMMEDPYVMSKIAHFGLHSYQNETSDAAGIANYVQRSSYPNTRFWMDEFNVWCANCNDGDGGNNTWAYAQGMAAYLLNLLNEGASAGIMWEAYDTEYYGYNADTGKNEPASWYYWGLFAVNDIDSIPLTYTPRQGFYTLSQISKYVRPGAQMISVSGTPASMTVLAFYNTNNAQFTITGVNTSSTASSLSCSLTSLPAIPALNLIYTSATTNLCNGGYVAVTNGNFSIIVPADCVFTLTYSNAAPYFLTPTVQNGNINLSLTVASGSSCQIQASPDLVNWGILTNVVSTNGTVGFTDMNANNYSKRVLSGDLNAVIAKISAFIAPVGIFKPYL